MNEIITPDWNSTFVDEHRRGISDAAWARQQPKEVNYFIGDVVEFKVGGFGVIDDVAHGPGDWPPGYSVKRVKGFAGHAKNKIAWHYEGDFLRLVAGGGPRVLRAQEIYNKAMKENSDGKA